MKGLRIVFLSAFVAVLEILIGCSNAEKSAASKPEAPAKLSGTAVKEAELTTVTLTPEAQARLGLRIEPATGGKGGENRRFTGEVVRPAGSSIVVSSPMAGTLQSTTSGVPAIGSKVGRDQMMFTVTPFLPVSRDVIVSAEGDIAQARTRLETARQRKARADRMLADEVGTVRAQEEAQQEVSLATSALQAAETRLKQVQSAPLDGTAAIQVRAGQDGLLRQIFVASGQTVSAGAPLFEVEDIRDVWIRVPVYAGEVQTLATKTAVSVQAISGTGTVWTAVPVDAPPSADSSSSTVHLYYRLANPDLRFRPGEKLMVSLRGSSSRDWIQVPWSSVVFDTHGGSWVYESLGDRRYARRRVDLDHSAGGKAYLRGGIAAGTPVVVEGVAELWGFEFGTGK
jgi:membrane fusion protein, heavy metal efflux system